MKVFRNSYLQKPTPEISTRDKILFGIAIFLLFVLVVSGTLGLLLIGFVI